MNNWHLLLLALAAVFKPIASFTERNLVDGRQQCCGREKDNGLKDGGSSLYRTDRFSKATTFLRRLDDWDETRVDWRSEVRQRDALVTRRSKERSLLDNRERDSGRDHSNPVRVTRVENRLERFSVYANGERRVDVERRERYARNTGDVNPAYQSIRDPSHVTRNSVMRHDDRTTELQARNSASRNDFQVSRFSNERLAKGSDSNRDLKNILRSLTPTRNARDTLRKFTPTTDTRVNRQETVRQRENEVQREISSRVEVRRYLNNNYEREQERSTDLHRAVNSRATERVHNKRLQDNSRNEIRGNRDRVSSNLRFMTVRSEEPRQLIAETRRNIKQTTDRKLSLENVNDERHNERTKRTRERYNEQRGALSEISRVDERIHDMRLRDNYRDEIRQKRDRVGANQRFTRKRPEERRQLEVESRDHIIQNTDRRLSRENYNDERRERERLVEQRRAPLDNSKIDDRKHNMRSRHHFRDENRDNGDRVSVKQRFMREGSEERRQQLIDSRNHIRQNTDRGLSRQNDERRDRERYAEQRRTLSEKSRMDERIHNMRLRDNVRDENRQNRDRASTDQQFMRRSSEERRQLMIETKDHIRQNTVRRLSRENNNEGHERESYAEQRRALLENSKVVKQIHNRRLRDNSRDENRENRDHVSTNLRFMRERSEDRRQLMIASKDSMRKNTDRRRSQDDNDERRERERHAEQRRALSESSRIDERIHNMRLRDNFRDEKRDNRDRVNTNQRFMRDRTEERRQLMVESREYMRRNTDRRLSRERMQMAVRDIRVPKLVVDRAIEDRGDIRHHERQNRATHDNEVVRERRVTLQESRRISSRELDNQMIDRRARSLDLRNFRDVRVQPYLRQIAEIVRASDGSRKQVENRKEINVREAFDTRFRLIDSRNGDMMDNKVENVNEAAANNWHYIFYTLQIAYLCGFFMQTMLPNRSEKTKMMNLRWWSAASHTPIKVD